jgi:hypothetical protein
MSLSTTIDNIFTDCTRFKNIDIKPFVNSISDYDAQLLTIYEVKVKCSCYRPAVAQRVGTGIALLFHDCSTRK